MVNPKPKRGKGRRRIEIGRIEQKAARKVCFSKRRNGLMRKASELSILTGAEIAIVVFSHGGKPYTFGSLSTIHRFLNRDGHVGPAASTLDILPASVNMDHHHRGNSDTTIKGLMDEQDKILQQIELEKKRYDSLKTLQQKASDQPITDRSITGADGFWETDDVIHNLDLRRAAQIPNLESLEYPSIASLKPTEDIIVTLEMPAPTMVGSYSCTDQRRSTCNQSEMNDANRGQIFPAFPWTHDIMYDTSANGGQKMNEVVGSASGFQEDDIGQWIYGGCCSAANYGETYSFRPPEGSDVHFTVDDVLSNLPEYDDGFVQEFDDDIFFP